MELVDGPPINIYCDRHGLDVPARLELFQKVCTAVQHAHHKGVIHRDLKPGNVLVVRGEAGHRPKVIDFGIARSVDRQLTDTPAFTEQGAMLGTPEYKSPEQALDTDMTWSIGTPPAEGASTRRRHQCPMTPSAASDTTAPRRLPALASSTTAWW